MPRKYLLSWNKASKCWVKNHDHKRYWLGAASSKSDTEAYERALTKWREIEATLIAIDPPKQETNKIEEIINKYISYIEDRAGKSMARSSAFTSIARINRVKGLLKGTNPNAEMLRSLRDDLLYLIKSKEISTTTARQLWAEMKTMLAYAYDVELIDALPRVYRKLKIPETQKPVINIYTIEQLRTIYNAIKYKDMKAYMCLALNCGFTQIDISTLDASEIKHGRIIRDRHKSKVHTDHMLWVATLLNFPPITEGRVFSNRNGNPICGDGKAGSFNLITARWNRLNRTLGFPTSFKLLRKSGASILDQLGCPFEIIQMYLGHTPLSVATKHYFRPSTIGNLLDPWLRKLEIVLMLEPLQLTDEEREWMNSIRTKESGVLN